MSVTTRAGLAALLVLSAACQPAPEKTPAESASTPAPAEFSASDEAAVRAVDSVFAVATNAGDGNAAGALYAADALMMPPGDTTVRGAGIAEYWTGVLSAYTFPIVMHTVAVEGRGDLAMITGTYSVTMSPKAAGAKPLPEDRGKYLAVLKKQADGSWKYAYDIWNSDAPPTQ